MRTTLQLAALAAASIAAFAASSGDSIYIDPASRWESIHDPNGSGATAEFVLDMQKACPAVQIASDRDSARYIVSFNRTNSSGSLLIYSGGSVVLAKKPGFAATLRKVAESVCSFVASH